MPTFNALCLRHQSHLYIGTDAPDPVNQLRDLPILQIFISAYDRTLFARDEYSSFIAAASVSDETGWLLIESCPVAAISSTIGVSPGELSVDLAGRSAGRPLGKRGVITIKMIKSTSKTSIKGVTFISDFPACIPVLILHRHRSYA